MNPQEYEMWHENFSGMLRLNPNWDSYDRMALELFRSKKRPLTVVEFGFTPKVTEWSKTTCFTQQMDWMAEQEIAHCLTVDDDPKFLELARRYPKVKAFCPTEMVDWFESVISGFSIADADLVFMGETIAGSYDWDKLKPGCLVVTPKERPVMNESFKKIANPGPLVIWKKQANKEKV